jgi:multidrug efflux pump subunit AcrA (membrane-fusion protein)
MPVELDVDNLDSRLAPGLFVEVSWPLRRPQPSLVVPVSAVAQTPDKTFVDVVREDVLEQVPVERGVSIAQVVEVFGPLKAGDLVLARASEELKSGARVEVRPSAPGAVPKAP